MRCWWRWMVVWCCGLWRRWTTERENRNRKEKQKIQFGDCYVWQATLKLNFLLFSIQIFHTFKAWVGLWDMRLTRKIKENLFLNQSNDDTNVESSSCACAAVYLIFDGLTEFTRQPSIPSMTEIREGSGGWEKEKSTKKRWKNICVFLLRHRYHRRRASKRRKFIVSVLLLFTVYYIFIHSAIRPFYPSVCFGSGFSLAENTDDRLDAVWYTFSVFSGFSMCHSLVLCRIDRDIERCSRREEREVGIDVDNPRESKTKRETEREKSETSDEKLRTYACVCVLNVNA